MDEARYQPSPEFPVVAARLTALIAAMTSLTRQDLDAR